MRYIIIFFISSAGIFLIDFTLQELSVYDFITIDNFSEMMIIMMFCTICFACSDILKAVKKND